MESLSHLLVPVEQQRRSDSHGRDGRAGAGICSGTGTRYPGGTDLHPHSRAQMPSHGMQGPPAPSPLSACSPSAVTKISSSVPKLGLKVPTFPASGGLGHQDERGEERSREQRSKGKHCPGLSSSPPAQDGGKQQLLWTIPCEEWPDEVVVHKFLGMRMKKPVGAHSPQHHELNGSLDPQGWEEPGCAQDGFTQSTQTPRIPPASQEQSPSAGMDPEGSAAAVPVRRRAVRNPPGHIPGAGAGPGKLPGDTCRSRGAEGAARRGH